MSIIRPIRSTQIKKFTGATTVEEADLIAVEEPLQLRLQWESDGVWNDKVLSITMRTPGHDFDLAMGFLWAENIIQRKEDILLIRYCKRVKPEEKGNVLLIRLSNDHKIPATVWERNFLTNSSCGICGKSAISAVTCLDEGPINIKVPLVSPEILHQLTSSLIDEQTGFKYTGGLHAAALFDLEGKILLLREDVGRHNALDKLIGAALKQNLLPAEDRIVLLSGRVSYEMVQKSVRAGIPILAAVGAPSSLAVDLALDKGTTLIGFLRNQRFNCYTHSERIG
ncbi:MAG TPA: formate dehydrogenase accessory sulfurtransferase FdhD [Lunatimonas sp.]|nr:formate dehydrogenase accessory sulfurtransferase FdhD [Lunatimonas sp.]